MPDTRSYIRARTALFKKQQAIAEQIQTHDAWTAVFDHHLGMLRLCAFDQTGLRLATPFLLLRLNRDDDAYCFCRHWLKSNPLIPGIENTRERDWIYPREENSRFRDITQEGGEQGLSCLCDISSLVALAVIKMRLVAMYDALMQNVATNSSQLLGPDEQEEVRRYIVGSPDHEQKLADQRRLLELLHERNASIVPALLHPEPLLRLPNPSTYSAGARSEARMVLDFALDVWRDIPGSDSILQARFGTSTPSYST